MVISPKPLTVNSLNQLLTSEVDKLLIIDVREKMELDIAYFPFSNIHIPISMVTLEYVIPKISEFSNKKFIILCHRGIRSYNFGQWLLENQLVKEVWNLEGGIDQWSMSIDPSIPRY